MLLAKVQRCDARAPRQTPAAAVAQPSANNGALNQSSRQHAGFTWIMTGYRFRSLRYCAAECLLLILCLAMQMRLAVIYLLAPAVDYARAITTFLAVVFRASSLLRLASRFGSHCR